MKIDLSKLKCRPGLDPSKLRTSSSRRGVRLDLGILQGDLYKSSSPGGHKYTERTGSPGNYKYKYPPETGDHSEKSSGDKPSDSGSYPFMALEELKKKPGYEELGEGYFGSVHFDPGPPPAAVKYGDVFKGEFELAKKAEELGVGPRVLAVQYGPEAPDKRGKIKDSKIAMEFLEGYETLEQAGSRLEGENEEEKQHIYRGMGKAMLLLGKLHEQGIAHRDLFGRNVMINPQGEAKLIDFGLARSGGPKLLLDDLTTGFEGRTTLLEFDDLTKALDEEGRQRYDEVSLEIMELKENYKRALTTHNEASLSEDAESFKAAKEDLQKIETAIAPALNKFHETVASLFGEDEEKT